MKDLDFAIVHYTANKTRLNELNNVPQEWTVDVLSKMVEGYR